MQLTFECTEDGRWFVVFPEYEGPQEDLEMVEGADEMLDVLTMDLITVTLDINIEEPGIGEYFILELESHDDDGAFYNVIDCPHFSGNIWLCNVVHELFNEHPERFYVQLINE